jgi:hypothetical protein
MELRALNIHIFGENLWEVSVNWENADSYQGLSSSEIRAITNQDSTLRGI